MKKEMFGGIGRTWGVVITTIVASTGLFWFDQIDVVVWKEMMQWALGSGAIKSTIVNAVTAWKSQGEAPTK